MYRSKQHLGKQVDSESALLLRRHRMSRISASSTSTHAPSEHHARGTRATANDIVPRPSPTRPRRTQEVGFADQLHRAPEIDRTRHGVRTTTALPARSASPQRTGTPMAHTSLPRDTQITVHIPGTLDASIHVTGRVDLIPAEGVAVAPLIRTLNEAGYRARERRRRDEHGVHDECDRQQGERD